MAKKHSIFGGGSSGSREGTANHRRVAKDGQIADNGNAGEGTGTRNMTPNDSGAPGAHGNRGLSGTP